MGRWRAKGPIQCGHLCLVREGGSLGGWYGSNVDVEYRGAHCIKQPPKTILHYGTRGWFWGLFWAPEGPPVPGWTLKQNGHIVHNGLIRKAWWTNFGAAGGSLLLPAFVRAARCGHAQGPVLVVEP